MSRWIDADALIADLDHGLWGKDWDKTLAEAIIRDAPSIDIVFCEKCRECVEKGVGIDCPSGYGYLYCRRKKSVVDETDYCSWGVEK